MSVIFSPIMNDTTMRSYHYREKIRGIGNYGDELHFFDSLFILFSFLKQKKKVMKWLLNDYVYKTGLFSEITTTIWSFGLERRQSCTSLHYLSGRFFFLLSRRTRKKLRDLIIKQDKLFGSLSTNFLDAYGLKLLV